MDVTRAKMTRLQKTGDFLEIKEGYFFLWQEPGGYYFVQQKGKLSQPWFILSLDFDPILNQGILNY